LAVAAAETGSYLPEVIEGLVSYVLDSPYYLPGIRAVRALAALPDRVKAPALARIMCHNPSGDAAEYAMLALLATCSRASVLAAVEDTGQCFSDDHRIIVEGQLFPGDA
jgi:hypothetical protein